MFKLLIKTKYGEENAVQLPGFTAHDYVDLNAANSRTKPIILEKVVKALELESVVDEQKHAAMIAAAMCVTHGHDWRFDCAKVCPKGHTGCSEPVDICQRCGVPTSFVFEIHPYCKECDLDEVQEKEGAFSIDDWNNNLDPFVRFALKSIFYGW